MAFVEAVQVIVITTMTMKGRSKMKRKTLYILASTLLIITLLSSPAVAKAPQFGGTLVAPALGDITNLNPLLKFNLSAYFITLNIYSSLVVWDYGREPYGDLAKSWDLSSDGLTYTFHLHDNVYWHDGVKFSSADVKFSYDLAKKNTYPIAKPLKLVTEILAPDEETIVFKLSEPDVAFIPMLAQASNWYGQILPRHLYEGTDFSKNPYNMKPVGTGPFKFEEWKSGEFISVVANKKWFHEPGS